MSSNHSSENNDIEIEIFDQGCGSFQGRPSLVFSVVSILMTRVVQVSEKVA